MSNRVAIPGLRDLDSPRRVENVLLATQDAWSDTGPIVLDFSACRAITPAGGAVIAMLKLYRDALGLRTEIDWDTLILQVRRQLARWRLLGLFPGGHLIEAGRSVPLLRQPTSDAVALVAFLERWVMPHFSMSQALQKETRKAFCEVFNNIFQHADSSIGGVAIGRLYPLSRPLPKLHVCVADRGVGLVERVLRAHPGLMSPAAAIEWALAQGNSTRLGPDPPGLGLYLLQEFVRANKGSLLICANGTWYSQVAGATTSGELTSAFPGTLIELRLYVRNDVSYDISYD